MAEWFIGAVMEKVIDSCQEYFKDQFCSQTGMQEELQRLREIHPMIQAVVSAHSQAQIEDSQLNEWLWKLRDAIDEADDVLDEIEYRKHEKQVSQNTRKRKAHALLEIGKGALKHALQIDPDLKRLKEAVQKLDKIATEVSTFHHLLDSKRQEQRQQQLDLREARETGSMPTDNLLGRSKEMESVREWLSNLDQTEITNTELYGNISLLSVVGHGGMGKTTLSQHVYIDGVTKEFGVKAWVCVSENFDAKKVITDILESIKKKRPSLETLDALQKSLTSEVQSKRALIVLDDVWEDDKEKWKKVLAPLSHVSSASKILITTRMNSVALMFAKIIKRSEEPMQLKGLEEDHCLQLLNKHAFDGVESPHVQKRLKSITREMVKKLYGSPLAAKVIGGILNFNLDASYWRTVLNSHIGNVNPDQNVLLPILKLSYIYLPKYLQNCFTFCGIFPQDHKFDKEDLVRMWIALGFILPQNIEEETIEDIGGRYFDILVKKSFFDKFHTGYDGVYFKMHDLLHELARFVSTKECIRVVDDRDRSIPQTIRHLSIHTTSLEETFKKIGEFKNLRSLLLSFSDQAKYDENFIGLLSGIFEASKSIRLLSICAPKLEIQMIPDTINSLIHLRYLNLDQKIFNLPTSVSHLYHLQFLIHKFVKFYGSAAGISRDMNNLYKLRHLSLGKNEHVMIHEIGKLKSLQQLDHFFVKNEKGFGIRELEHINELRKIGVYQLENIKDANEACIAKFCDKKNLTDLSLDWGDGFGGRRENIVDHGLVEKILDGIQPNKNLERLCISQYFGVRSAKWMKDVYFTSSNLEHIRLEKCFKWKTLPPFGQLPFLKFLYLYNMPEVEKLDHTKDCMFPLLEVLQIEGLGALQEWFDTTLAENECFLPCLTELFLSSCPKLQELPFLPTKLQKLEMFEIGWKSCNWLQGIRNCSRIRIVHLPNLINLEGRQELKADGNCQLIIEELKINDLSVLLMEPLRSVSSLSSLEIEKIDKVVSFPIETEQWFLQLSSSLSELKLCYLQSLQSLPSSLESLSSLNTLHVYNVPRLKLLPKLPSSLRELGLYHVESLESLPSCLSTISSLKRLILNGASHLKSLPDLPSSLEWLMLNKLDSLQCMPSSLSTIVSLNLIRLSCIPLLESLPDLPSSLEKLEINELKSLQSLPSSLSTISSLIKLELKNIRLLKSLPNLPSSLKMLRVTELESLQCIQSSLSTISTLEHLKFKNIPHLKSLPHLPSSLRRLQLRKLESWQCLPSLSTISSLTELILINIPLLKSLPELPSSLKELHLRELENLDCLPSCLPTLQELFIFKVPRLQELPDLPASLRMLSIEGCNPQLMERYKSFEYSEESVGTVS